MEFKIWRASGAKPEVATGYYKEDEDNWYVQIETVEDILRLIKEVGLICLDRDSIMIYDDYVE